MILAVDDVHLLDPLGAAFIYYAIHSGQAMLAATRRTGEPVHAPISALWREDLTTAIPLGPLDETTVGELLARVLGGAVDPGARGRLWQLSQGNVLLLREVVEALVEQGAFDQRRGLWTRCTCRHGWWPKPRRGGSEGRVKPVSW